MSGRASLRQRVQRIEEAASSRKPDSTTSRLTVLTDEELDWLDAYADRLGLGYRDRIPIRPHAEAMATMPAGEAEMMGTIYRKLAATLPGAGGGETYG